MFKVLIPTIKLATIEKRIKNVIRKTVIDRLPLHSTSLCCSITPGIVPKTDIMQQTSAYISLSLPKMITVIVPVNELISAIYIAVALAAAGSIFAQEIRLGPTSIPLPSPKPVYIKPEKKPNTLSLKIVSLFIWSSLSMN